MSAEVRATYRQLLQEVRRLGWQSLGIGTGLWLEAAICTERFVADSADALERRKPEPKGWDSRIISEVDERLIRVARGCELRTKAWRRLAARIDATLIERGSLAR